MIISRIKRPVLQSGKMFCLSIMGLALANCAGSTGKGRVISKDSREVGAFSDPKYGQASPRVVDTDETAPKGGGRYQVGKPYSVAGKLYVPQEKPKGYIAIGNASWYGVAFHGRKTANGEVYDRNAISAAHPTFPLPSYARVTNVANNHSIIVRVNDRGPYHGGRVMDVSERTATLLNFKHLGTARVKIDYLGQAGLKGSDDDRLLASLNRNGQAFIPGSRTSSIQVANFSSPIQEDGVAFTNAVETPVNNSNLVAEDKVTQSVFNHGRLVGSVPSGETNAASVKVVVPASPLPIVNNVPQPPVRPFALDAAALRQAQGDAGQTRIRPTALVFIEGMEGGPSSFRNGHPFSEIGKIGK